MALGVSITPMLTALGVGGLAVALALQEPLANLFAGIVIALARQVRVGDYVKLDTGVEGYITDFSWWSTRIRMLSNNMVLVPNAKLAQAIVTNYHLPAPDVVVPVDVGVDPASDLLQVERVTLDVGREVMREVPGGVKEFEPVIRYHTFAAANVGFSVTLGSKEFAGQDPDHARVPEASAGALRARRDRGAAAGPDTAGPPRGDDGVVAGAVRAHVSVNPRDAYRDDAGRRRTRSVVSTNARTSGASW